MGLVQLESASLEASSSGTSSKLLYTNSSSVSSASPASRSSFNFLDRIKRSSTKMNSEIKKRMPIEQTFTSITESLSQSSGEIAEVFSKQFSLFKTSSSGGEQEVTFETRDDGGIGAKVASPEHRTSHLHDVIGEKSHQLSSPLHSIGSNSSVESWDESTMGSREFSLLDTVPSGDEDGENAEYSDDGDDATYFGDTDTAQYFGDARSPDSQDTTRFDDFAEEDGMAAIGGVLMQIGSCNFKEELATLHFEEDDYSVLSDAFRLNSMKNFGLQKKEVPIPTVQGGAPGKRGILDAMFSCHG
jgi:hypothetical protein